MYKRGDLIAFSCGRDRQQNIAYKTGLFFGIAEVYDEKSDWGVYGVVLTDNSLRTIWLHGSKIISECE